MQSYHGTDCIYCQGSSFPTDKAIKKVVASHSNLFFEICASAIILFQQGYFPAD